MKCCFKDTADDFIFFSSGNKREAEDFINERDFHKDRIIVNQDGNEVKINEYLSKQNESHALIHNRVGGMNVFLIYSQERFKDLYIYEA